MKPNKYIAMTIILGIVVISLMLATNLQAPVEQIPLDAGIIGFLLIFLNGFLLSHILAGNDVDSTERLIISISIGFGITSSVMLLIGILWEISLATIIFSQATLLVILLTIMSYKKIKLNFEIRPWLRRNNFFDHMSSLSLPKVILFTAIGICTIFAIYRTVAYPVVEWDTLAYGVNYAKIIFDDKKVPLIAGPSIGLEMSANYPPGVQLIAVYLYNFAGASNDLYYRILQPIFGLLVMLITYKFSLGLSQNRTVSLFAVLILSTIPLFWILFIQETYLMYLTLMLTLAAYFFFKAYNSHDGSARKYEIIGTLFCGFSTLASYIGIFSLGIVLLYAINRKLSVKRLGWLMSLISCIMLPWYIRNLLLLGNPLYPFFGVGKYLDPLLIESSMQHFQNWLKQPFYGLTSLISKLVTVIAASAIVYYSTIVKRRHFDTLLSLYLLFSGFLIMSFHVPFPRYLMIALPILSVAASKRIKSFLVRHDLIENKMTITFALLITISVACMIPSMNIAKPAYNTENKWDYLSQAFQEGDAWKWINENTPENSTIATYDIKEYYIDRKIMSLDGYEAAPLYKMDTIEEALDYLREQNVTYLLSVPWASPLDFRMPPAYEWCVLTRYLGDPRYLPPIYVDSSGATVYNVGALEEKTLDDFFSQKEFVPPTKHVEINLTITNNSDLPSGEFCLPIPVDYGAGLMMASVNSYGHSVGIELLSGIYSEEMNTTTKDNLLVKRWPQPINSTGVENPSFAWQINETGYFTFQVFDRKSFGENFNVTVDIRFCNYWDIKSLFISQDVKTYNATISEETFPLMKVLYLQVNAPSMLSINSTTFGKKISLQILQDFVPNNVVINWTEQYKTIELQPNFNETLGEVDPSIQNMLLSSGRYSILILYRDNPTEQTNISLDVKVTPLI
jgi:hypothetical protein